MRANKPMTREQLAVLADDINSMAQEIIDTRDVRTLRNMTANLARMIRIHVPEPPSEDKEG